jgi:hypothetical protein
MKRRWLIGFLLCVFPTAMICAESYGVKLVSIIDYGREALVSNLSRSVIWGGDKSLIVTSDYNIGMKLPYGDPKLLIYDIQSRRILVPALVPPIRGIGVNRMQDGIHFRLYASEGVDGTGRSDIFVVSLEDASMRKLNADEAKANLKEIVRWAAPLKWPSDLAKPESIKWRLDERDHIGAMDDWAVWKKALIVTAGPGMSFDGSYQGFSAFDVEGRWLLRFPYIITPVVDDQGMGGSTVEVGPDERYLLINGHAYVKDIFPGDFPGSIDGRIEVGFIYKLLTTEEWQSEQDFSARYVRFDEGLTKVALDLPIDSKRFSVAPGETPLWGLYGRLTSDKVNLREKPLIPSLVLTLMNKTVAGKELKFVIRERTATKTRVGNQEDYWYRVTYEIPRGFSPDKRDHSWTGWVFGSYVEILPPEKQYGS